MVEDVKVDPTLASLNDKQLKQQALPFAKFKMEEAMLVGPQVGRRERKEGVGSGFRWYGGRGQEGEGRRERKEGHVNLPCDACSPSALTFIPES